MSKTIKQQIEDRCIHFTGIQNQVCKAGIKYVDIRDESQKPYLFPCNRNLKNSGSHCDKCQFPTVKQVDELLKEIYNGQI